MFDLFHETFECKVCERPRGILLLDKYKAFADSNEVQTESKTNIIISLTFCLHISIDL